MPKDDSDSSSTLGDDGPRKRPISPPKPSRFTNKNVRNIRQEIAEQADTTSDRTRHSPNAEEKASVIQRVTLLERTVEHLSAALELQQERVETESKGERCGRWQSEFTTCNNCHRPFQAEESDDAKDDFGDMECLSHEHLKNLEWALGCIATCEFDLDCDMHDEISKTRNDPFAAAGTEQAQLKLRQICEALSIGVKAMAQAARLGKDSSASEAHLLSACLDDPAAVMVLMERGVEDMGGRLGYGPLGPYY